MKKFNYTILLLLFLGLSACTDNQHAIDTEPATDAVQGRSGDGPESNNGDQDDPNTKINGGTMYITIAIEYPDGFDRDLFRQEFGPFIGLLEPDGVLGCISPSNNRELWVIEYLSEEDFELLLNLYFNTVVPPKTTSNGTGADEPYTATKRRPAKTWGDSTILIWYNGVCN